MLDRVVALTMFNFLIYFHIGFQIEEIGDQNATNGLAVESEQDLIMKF